MLPWLPPELTKHQIGWEKCLGAPLPFLGCLQWTEAVGTGSPDCTTSNRRVQSKETVLPVSKEGLEHPAHLPTCPLPHSCGGGGGCSCTHAEVAWGNQAAGSLGLALLAHVNSCPWECRSKPGAKHTPRLRFRLHWCSFLKKYDLV